MITQNCPDCRVPTEHIKAIRIKPLGLHRGVEYTDLFLNLYQALDGLDDIYWDIYNIYIVFHEYEGISKHDLDLVLEELNEYITDCDCVVNNIITEQNWYNPREYAGNVVPEASTYGEVLSEWKWNNIDKIETIHDLIDQGYRFYKSFDGIRKKIFEDIEYEEVII